MLEAIAAEAETVAVLDWALLLATRVVPSDFVATLLADPFPEFPDELPDAFAAVVVELETTRFADDATDGATVGATTVLLATTADVTIAVAALSQFDTTH